ncbi:MAG: hypothetical protein A2945_01555 [Candidatus Liptonbacteria bacterium RIFCSPLOWO2_01_FULL_52_25]|uniref:Bacterial Ig domain-containing protein n=1 Tax=Candidatus Liptonbacteria bacterium RIFCSPLOWO2_01_FULL_52_25 TaxID=1798650 RepID=A0A1G2CDR8_9BACT|nr:MAG: hypothetical protein A2945_01555 [Candidatus Liptonbacteria bacterium RIFCSPLOWO2_01_FULL_52_25]
MKNDVYFLLRVILLALLGQIFLAGEASAQLTATTTVRVDVCGDGLVSGNEVCDSGFGQNTGLYSTSTTDRHCNATCSVMGPYCGDSVLQSQYAEACDDGNNTSLDRCSAVCVIENLPSGGGGGGAGVYSPGGYVSLPETQVIITGKAYPNANVHILKDGTDIAVVAADAKADFYFTITKVSPGVVTFGFWAQDANGLKSAALTTTLSIVANVVTTISGAFLPPTLNTDKRKVDRGDTIIISGQSPPAIKVVTHVNSEEEIIQDVTSGADGTWKLAFDTTALADEDFHTAKALFEMKIGENVVQSAFSQAVSFYVGQSETGTQFISDLNGDKKINLIDFSVLLFYWGTSGPTGDLNNDSKVGLTDFSILLFNWTG